MKILLGVCLSRSARIWECQNAVRKIGGMDFRGRSCSSSELLLVIVGKDKITWKGTVWQSRFKGIKNLVKLDSVHEKVTRDLNFWRFFIHFCGHFLLLTLKTATWTLELNSFLIFQSKFFLIKRFKFFFQKNWAQ